jgi:20S proteasome subunit beta 7
MAYPIVTGTSVIGIKYKDGVMLCSDMNAAYGTTLRYKSVSRLHTVGKHTVIGASGEMSDFQYLQRLLDELMTEDFTSDDGETMTPKEIHCYLTRVLYNRRSKFDPLWNNLVIAGYRDGEPYLGTVNNIGVSYTDVHIATGMGQQMARPMLRAEHREDMTEDEAIHLLEKCMRVLFYRDRGASDKMQIAKVTKDGVTVSKSYAITSKWDYKFFENPAQGALGSW